MEAFGLAANILSVIHITTEVLERLNEFRNQAGGLPKALQAFSNELPALRLCLKRIATAEEDGVLPDDSREALKPIMDDCKKQIEALGVIIEKVQAKGASDLVRNVKAVASFRYDSEVQYRKTVIREYISTLTLERVISGTSVDLAVLRTPLVPRFICPFGQDSDFIERDILADIISVRAPGSRHALVGGSGMGKSQIAIEYGYRIQKDYPGTWVFWVDTENIAKFEEGYRDIAKTLELRGRNDKDADIFNLVYEWLRNETNANWVMILDNADDKDVFTSQPPNQRASDTTKHLCHFIPQSSNGSILVTSRSRDAAFQVTCNYKHIKTVEGMSESEALTLLRTHLNETHDEEDMKLLVKTLAYIPLAVTHAAAYISRTSLPICDYLQKVRMEDETSASLLDENLPQLRRDAGRSNSIVMTWRVTFEYVRKTTPSAARLLSLMCLFDRQDIPEALLEGQYGEEVIAPPPKPRKAWWKRRPRMRRKPKQKSKQVPTVRPLPRKFDDDWLVLRDFSMIKLNKDRHHFSMHPLVQFTTKKWLVLHKELDAWSQRFIAILDNRFHDSDDGGFKKCEPLLAHAYAAIPYRPSDLAMPPLRAWASLTRKVARYYDQRTALDTAQKMYRVAGEALEITLGRSAPETLKCKTLRALVLFAMDREDEAEKIHRQVLALQQQTLGRDHADTLDTMDHIGDTLVFQNRHSEAEALHVQALDSRLRKLGPTHESTQSSLNKRGIFLLGRSRYPEAYKIWRQAYEARRKGKEDECDFNWCDELDLIGLRLQMDGRSSAAEPYFREALTEKERTLPPGCEGYSVVLKSVVSLARVLAEQEKYDEAELLFRRALEWYSRPAWVQRPERLQAMSEVASVLLRQEKLEEAESLSRMCLLERAEMLGPKHRETLEIAWILGGVLEKQKQYEEAIQLYKRASEGAQETLGDRHEDTKDYQRDYTTLCDSLATRLSRNETAVVVDTKANADSEDTCAGAEESPLRHSCGRIKSEPSGRSSLVPSKVAVDLEHDDAKAETEEYKDPVSPQSHADTKPKVAASPMHGANTAKHSTIRTTNEKAMLANFERQFGSDDASDEAIKYNTLLALKAPVDLPRDVRIAVPAT